MPKREEYSWEKYKRTMDGITPQPSGTGFLLSTGSLAAPIIGGIFFSTTGAVLGLLIGSVLGLLLLLKAKK